MASYVVLWVACTTSIHATLQDPGHLFGELSGKLIYVWGQGENTATAERSVSVFEGESVTKVEVEYPHPVNVEWLEGGAFLVNTLGRGSDAKILRYPARDEPAEILGDSLLIHAMARQTGWRTVGGYDGSAEFTEIRDDRMRVVKRLVAPTRWEGVHVGGLAYHSAWHPKGDRLAIGVLVSNERYGLLPRLAVAPERDEWRPRVVDGVPENVKPQFWAEEGIYATEVGVLLRCQEGSDGCKPIYDPGRAHAIMRGVPLGATEALLLVRRPSLGGRAKEVHRIDRTTGRLIQRIVMPDGIYLADLEWIESSPEPQTKPACGP